MSYAILNISLLRSKPSKFSCFLILFGHINFRDEIEKTEWLEAVRDAVEKQKVINQDEKDAVAPVW